MQNSAHQLEALLIQFQGNKKELYAVREKLSIHEYYRNIINKIDRGHGIDSCSDADYLVRELTSFAKSLRAEAAEYLTKPESFDDISDEAEQTTPRS